MNLTAGYPYSLIRYGLPFNYPTLESDLKTDVLIMGGGISGALMAHYLLEHDIDCVLIDGRTIGLGSTSASTSLLQYEIDVPLCELKDKIGLDAAVRAYKQCASAIDTLGEIAHQIGFEQFASKQSLYYAAKKGDDNFLKKEFNIRKENGFDVSLLDEQEILASFGLKASSGILSSKAAHTNAYTFTHALLQYNLTKGLQVYDRTKAEKIMHSKAGVKIKTERGQMIKASKIIYATGYEAVNYIDKKIVNLQSTYAVCSEQIGKPFPIDQNTVYWSTGDPYLYIRTTEDNRILVGGRDEDFYNPKRRDELILRKSTGLVKDYKRLFDKETFNPEFSWAGTFGSTVDGLPFIGEYKKLPNGYFALGFGGNGITFSLIAAKILSDVIKGKQNTIDKMFSFDRI